MSLRPHMQQNSTHPTPSLRDPIDIFAGLPFACSDVGIVLPKRQGIRGEEEEGALEEVPHAWQILPPGAALRRRKRGVERRGHSSPREVL